ncbi:MAG TPA: copper amine oxidase N-terminal domain-containing protein, partial [Paenibacillaceae bacterium]
VRLESGSDDRALRGEIAFDNLKLHYPAVDAEPPRAEIVLKSGSTEAVRNGEAIRLDAAPFQQDGVTYVPLRFIADSLGGSVLWDNGLKRVTVLRDFDMVELRVNSPDMTVNGVRQAAAASPLIRNGRVMVPVRVVAEQLGLQVVWDGQAKTITIR